MVFAFIYLVLQKRQVLSEGKGEALFPAKISNLLLFLSVVSFIVRPFLAFCVFSPNNSSHQFRSLNIIKQKIKVKLLFLVLIAVKSA